MENTHGGGGGRSESNPWLVDAAWQLIQNHTSDTMVSYGVTYPTLDATMEPESHTGTHTHTHTHGVSRFE